PQGGIVVCFAAQGGVRSVSNSIPPDDGGCDDVQVSIDGLNRARLLGTPHHTGMHAVARRREVFHGREPDIRPSLYVRVMHPREELGPLVRIDITGNYRVGSWASKRPRQLGEASELETLSTIRVEGVVEDFQGFPRDSQLACDDPVNLP